MFELKRIIKPKLVKELLSKAEGLARPDWVMTLESKGKAIVQCTASGSSPEGYSFSQEICSQEICAHHVPLGIFHVDPGNGCSDAEKSQAQSLCNFISHTLCEIANSEAARRSIAAETLDKYREIELLHKAINSMNNSLRLREVTQSLMHECVRAGVPAEMGMLFLHEPDAPQAPPIYSYGESASHQLHKLSSTRLFKDVTSNGRGEIINSLAKDTRWDNDIPSIRSLLIIPLSTSNLRVGTLALTSTSENVFQAAHLKRINTLATVAAISMGNAHHFEGIQVLMDALLKALAAAIDARDPLTSGHSQRVANLSVSLARVVNDDRHYFSHIVFDDRDIHEIWYAGLLHDVGKIGVREQVLTKSTRIPDDQMDIVTQRLIFYGQCKGLNYKECIEKLERINRTSRLTEKDLAFIEELRQTPFSSNGSTLTLLTSPEADALSVTEGNLTKTERAEIERHPQESFRILQHIPFTEDFSRLLSIIQQHHERLDGSGYPAGLQEQDILLQSRILAITDVYDAITQERHYKPAMPKDKALEVLESEAAKGKIDARLVALFKENIDRVEAQTRDLEREYRKQDPNLQDKGLASQFVQ